MPALIATAASWLTHASASLLRGSITQAIGFLLTFYFLFYFLRDRRTALTSVLSLSPLSETELSQIASRVVDTIHATFYGTIVCAAVQGTLGGLMFLWLGLPAPFLWGVIMGLLAIVPIFGAFISVDSRRDVPGARWPLGKGLGSYRVGQHRRRRHIALRCQHPSSPHPNR